MLVSGFSQSDIQGVYAYIFVTDSVRMERMTGWIERARKAIVGRISARGMRSLDLVPCGEGLKLPDGTMLLYCNIVRAAAFKSDDYIGETFCVALEFREGRSIVVNERHAVWRDVLAALDRNPRRRYSSLEWLFHVNAASGKPLAILA